MKGKLFLLLLLVNASVYSQSIPLSVFANKNVPLAETSFVTLQNIFMGKQPKWSNGDKVVIALMKFSTPAGKETCSKLYKMTPDQVTRYWLTLSIKGKIDAPIFFNTTAELQRFVSANRGAIGIVNGITPISGIKLLLVDKKNAF
jgi:hypothetical protein